MKVVRFWKGAVAPAAIVRFSHRSNLEILIFQRCCVLGRACFCLVSIFKKETGLFPLLTKDLELGLPTKGKEVQVLLMTSKVQKYSPFECSSCWVPSPRTSRCWLRWTSWRLCSPTHAWNWYWTLEYVSRSKKGLSLKKIIQSGKIYESII